MYSVAVAAARVGWPGRSRDFVALTKPRLDPLVLLIRLSALLPSVLRRCTGSS